MSRFKSIKLIAAALVTLSVSSNSFAASVFVDGQKFKSYDEMSDHYYVVFSNLMSNSITSKTLGKSELTKMRGKFAFVSPPLETWSERYVVNGSHRKKPISATELLIGYGEQMRSEMIFYFFEKMGLVDHIDVLNERGFNKDVEHNYDYVVTMRSDFNGKRDIKSAMSQKTEYFVRNVKTGKEQKFAEKMGNPVLVGFFESVAVKFSDAVKATN